MDSDTPLSVFMPFYNEEDVIEEVVTDANRYLSSMGREYEIILVNDGSDDKTPEVIQNLEQKFEEVHGVHHETNEGYGRALATGFKASKNPLIFYTDGDGQFDITELPKLLEHVPEYDLVIGHREVREDKLSRRVVGWGFNSIAQLTLGFEVKDIDCAFKLVKKEVIDSIELDTTRTVDAELLKKSIEAGYRIKEVPVSHHPRENGESEAEGLLGVRTSLITKTLQELLYIRLNS